MTREDRLVVEIAAVRQDLLGQLRRLQPLEDVRSVLVVDLRRRLGLPPYTTVRIVERDGVLSVDAAPRKHTRKKKN